MPGKNRNEVPETNTFEELAVYGEQITRKNEEFERLKEELNEHVGKIDPKTKEEIEIQINELEGGRLTEDALLMQYSNEESSENKAIKVFMKARKIINDLNELHELHKPRKAYELAKYAEEVSAHFDWDAFFEYYDSKKGQKDEWDSGHLVNGLESTIRMRQARTKAYQGTLVEEEYETLEYWQKQIEEQHAEWKKRGFLREQPIPSTVENVTKEEITAYRIDMKERLKYALETLVHYGNLRNTYRALNTEYNFQDISLEHIVFALDLESNSMNMGNEWKEAEYDPRMLLAIDRVMEKKRQQYTDEEKIPVLGQDYLDLLKNAQDTELETVLNSIKIEGLEPKPGEELLVTEAQLRELLGNNIPPYFLNKIEVVFITDRPKDLDMDEINNETIGVHIPEFDDKGNLVKSRIEIYTKARVPEGTDETAKALAKAEFETTVMHEIAHRIHHELSFDEMRDWEIVTEKDKTDVTWYVEHMRRKNETRGKREDFAETFAMAVLSPGYLYMLSTDRFNYMMGLIGRYMGEEQRQIFVDEIQTKIKNYTVGTQELAKLIAQRKVTDEKE